jgi:hypothetical protein
MLCQRIGRIAQETKLLVGDNIAPALLEFIYDNTISIYKATCIYFINMTNYGWPIISPVTGDVVEIFARNIDLLSMLIHLESSSGSF